MGWFADRTARRVERAKEMCSEAKDAMNSVESPYVVANQMVSEYEKALKFKPGSAYRYAKKAYRSAIDESQAAKTHRKAADLLSNQKRNDDKDIAKLEKTYTVALASGKCRKALKAADEMLKKANMKADPCPVAVKVDFDDLAQGRIKIVVINRSPDNLVINSVSASSGSAALDLGAAMSEALASNASMVREVAIDPNASQEVSVKVEYEAGVETSTVTKHFPILRGV